MGEAKRRKEQLGDKYGQEKSTFPGLPGLSFDKAKSEKFVQWTTRGAWIGIFVLGGGWVVIRFIGPSFGWWEVQ
jgi:Protein of unknown function (DUF2839)